MNSSLSQTEGFDAIVVGAGVVGCAVARRLTLEGARVLVLERAVDILDGASKGNSALLHTGFDAPPGSVEQRCLEQGYREYLAIHDRLNLPILESGALVLAWNDDEADKLDGIVARAHANGVTDVQAVSPSRVAILEPGVAAGVVSAVSVPGEYIIDPWSTPHAYLLQALTNGASLQRDCEVTGGVYAGGEWEIETSRGHYRTTCVINCAGLHGDTLNRRLLGEPLFQIRPRKGQFVVYDKSAARLVRRILLPVPGEHTKGVVVCRTLFGNLLVGPTAEEQESRDQAEVDSVTLQALMQRGAAIVPALSRHPVTATYAGIRPASEHKDYRIETSSEPRYVSVGGIRSTGLSAALGIANLVHERFTALCGSTRTLPAVNWPQLQSISEYGPRDWQRAGNGGIVCHCELVTRREIERALEGELGARSLGGLKRRTRATMGRCQGFYCSARLAEICAPHFDSTDEAIDAR